MHRSHNLTQIVLIACGKNKLPHPAPARKLYTGTLFRMSWRYAKSFQPAATYILSAKHGLLLPDVLIEPYDQTLIGRPAEERRVWAANVFEAIEKRHRIADSHFVILAGNAYREYLVQSLPSWEAPLQGLGIGEQLGFLKRALQ